MLLLGFILAQLLSLARMPLRSQLEAILFCWEVFGQKNLLTQELVQLMAAATLVHRSNTQIYKLV